MMLGNFNWKTENKSEMAPWVKTPVAKPANLSSISKPRWKKEKTHF